VNGLEKCTVLQPIIVEKEEPSSTGPWTEVGEQRKCANDTGVRPADYNLPGKAGDLGAIAGINAHVFGGEIAGPVTGGGAASVQVYDYVDILFEQAIAGGTLVEV